MVLENLFSFYQTPSFDAFFYYFEMGVVFGAVLGFVFWLYNRMQYKYLVNIYTRREETGYTMTIDHAKIVNRKGVKKLLLRKLHKKIEPIDFKYMCNASGFAVRGGFALLRYGEDSFAVLRPRDLIDTKGVTLDPIENDVAEMCSILDEVNQKLDKSEFWNTYGPILVQIAFFVILVIAIAILMKGVREVSNTNLEATRLLLQAIKDNGVSSATPASIFPPVG